MLLALHLLAVVVTLAATIRAAGRARVLGPVAGVAALAAFTAGARLDAPSPLRGALWVYGVACLGKTLALGRGPRGAPGPSIGIGRGLGYVFFWPGLEPAGAFTRDPAVDRRAGLVSAAVGALEVLAAFALSSLAASTGLLDAGPYPAAWVRLLAFGGLLDGGFRALEGLTAAFGARPERVFRRPWAANDLADFWGRRWNRFVGRTLALEVFAPVKRRAGRPAGVLAAFLASGLLHEALFRGSTPGPAGRYVAFFLLHGLGVVLTARVPAVTPRGRGARRVAAWTFLLATAPLFFGGCYPAVVPLEDVLPR